MRVRKPDAIVTGADTLDAVPKPPVWLSSPAKAEWKRVAPILINERKTLTLADLPTLANYCAMIGRSIDAERQVSREGATFTAPNGMIKKHPAVTIQAEAIAQARLLASELGLTPVSRSRPSIRTEDASEDLSFLD